MDFAAERAKELLLSEILTQPTDNQSKERGRLNRDTKLSPARSIIVDRQDEWDVVEKSRSRTSSSSIESTVNVKSSLSYLDNAKLDKIIHVS